MTCFKTSDYSVWGIPTSCSSYSYYFYFDPFWTWTKSWWSCCPNPRSTVSVTALFIFHQLFPPNSKHLAHPALHLTGISSWIFGVLRMVGEQFYLNLSILLDRSSDGIVPISFCVSFECGSFAWPLFEANMYFLDWVYHLYSDDLYSTSYDHIKSRLSNLWWRFEFDLEVHCLYRLSWSSTFDKDWQEWLRS